MAMNPPIGPEAISVRFFRQQSGGLYEVRTPLEGRIARVLFAFKDGQIILLHGFIKKSQKTPKPDLDLAKERMKKL